jgi:hypothetical protein
VVRSDCGLEDRRTGFPLPVKTSFSIHRRFQTNSGAHRASCRRVLGRGGGGGGVGEGCPTSSTRFVSGERV